ncbi:MAG: SMP-30/gluconolactonase/LRE family protein [Oscillospiraceae bacterium]|nr:SMP-30/gluconolactonase/LRE family protein [Oscillospiraceae bacterium]
MKVIQAELLVDSRCKLAEGPIYDHQRNGLYWLDIEANRIYYMDLSSERVLYIQMDRPIGSIVLTDKGNILAGMDDGVYLINELRCEPYCLMKEAAAENIRFNDGKCDPAGRFIVGTQVNPNNAELGCLFSVTGKNTYEVLSCGLGCSNGLAWTTDGKTMYHVDSLVQTPSKVFAYDYNVETGTATNRREIIDYAPLAQKGILADGMTIDCQGNLWIAEWGGYGVGCWDPRTGTKIAHVAVPAERVSCCTFGGEDNKTLFITTAAGDGQYAGGVFQAKMDVAGFTSVNYCE